MSDDRRAYIRNVLLSEHPAPSTVYGEREMWLEGLVQLLSDIAAPPIKVTVGSHRNTEGLAKRREKDRRDAMNLIRVSTPENAEHLKFMCRAAGLPVGLIKEMGSQFYKEVVYA